MGQQATVVVVLMVTVLQLSSGQSTDAPVSDNSTLCGVPKMCPPDEVYACCGPCVDRDCFNLKQGLPECLRCAGVCLCRDGFVRKYPGGPCIHQNTCRWNAYAFFGSG